MAAEQPPQSSAPVDNQALNPEQVRSTGALAGEQNASDGQGLTDYERYKMQKEQEMLSDDYTSGQNDQSYAQSQAGAYDTTFSEGQTYQDQYYEDNNQQPAVVNNYYYNNDDDYYDYYYTSRLRRFHSPYYGWNYYDPWYSDNYWYTYNPVKLGYKYLLWLTLGFQLWHGTSLTIHHGTAAITDMVDIMTSIPHTTVTVHSDIPDTTVPTGMDTDLVTMVEAITELWVWLW